MNFAKKSTVIILLAWLAYLISYLGRSNYSSCLLEIINETSASRATAGMVSSVFAICNAIGQLASGFIIKKFSPVKVIIIELFSVAIINLLFPAVNSFYIMAVLWGINGCMQSTLLCSITMIFTKTLKEPYLSRGAVLLNTIGAVGGMFNYILSWLIIRYFNWQIVFLTVATMLFIFGIIWCIIMPKVAKLSEPKPLPQDTKEKNKQNFSVFAVLKSYGAIFAVLGALFIGLLRESVSLWIPSFINENFNLRADLSIIITSLVPCLQICGALLGGRIGRFSKNLFLLSSTAFVLSGICLLTIRIIGNFNILITLILFILNAICMTATLTFLLSLYPIRYFKKETTVILVGIINFFVHVGDFVASFGIGLVSQTGGWNTVFIILSIAAFLAAIICLLGSFANKRSMYLYVKKGV